MGRNWLKNTHVPPNSNKWPIFGTCVRKWSDWRHNSLSNFAFGAKRYIKLIMCSWETVAEKSFLRNLIQRSQSPNVWITKTTMVKLVSNNDWNRCEITVSRPNEPAILSNDKISISDWFYRNAKPVWPRRLIKYIKIAIGRAHVGSM